MACLCDRAEIGFDRGVVLQRAMIEMHRQATHIPEISYHLRDQTGDLGRLQEMVIIGDLRPGADKAEFTGEYGKHHALPLARLVHGFDPR